MDNREYGVDVLGMRSTIRRMFDSSWSEVFAELLQNAQRAEATRFEFRWADGDTMDIEDNGRGLKSMSDWESLLILGDTNFDIDNIRQQNPMGVGFYSMLTHKAVDFVSVSSHGKALDIDTKKWFEDPSYFRTSAWKTRIYDVEDDTPFRIIVHITEVDYMLQSRYAKSVIGYAADHCPAADRCPYALTDNAKGYSLVNLSVFCNGTEIDNKPRLPYQHFFEGSYMGHKVLLEPGHLMTVYWYGQCIPLHAPCGGVMMVTGNGARPLEPKSPTRMGFVKDEKLDAFITFLQNRIWDYALETKDVWAVQKCQQAKTFPYVVLIPASNNRRGLPYYHVVPKTDIPYIFDEEIYVHDLENPDESDALSINMSEFIGKNIDIPVFYEPEGVVKLPDGSSLRPNCEIHWYPGKVLSMSGNTRLVTPGIWKLIDEENTVIEQGEVSEAMLGAFRGSPSDVEYLTDVKLLEDAEEFADEEDPMPDSEWTEEVYELQRELLAGLKGDPHISKQFLYDITKIIDHRIESIHIVDPETIRVVYEGGEKTIKLWG